jgi:gluconate 2-dehydrogenase gamma chain
MDRRRFLQILAATVASAKAGDLAAAMAHGEAHVVKTSALGTMGKTYTYFTDAEAQFVESAVARLIPADDLGPGALEADVPYFIDQQLAGEYGAGARFYQQGPFGDTTGRQGYQLPLSPSQLYRVGIAATDRYCREVYGKRFAALDEGAQDEVLKGLQGVSSDVSLEEVPGATFFGHLITDTKDGFFADPAYGGNRDKVGWKLVGYPGVAASYGDVIGRNEPYDVEPVGMHDVRQARVPTDQHGHPIHQRAAVPRKTTPPERHDDGEDVAIDWEANRFLGFM